MEWRSLNFDSPQVEEIERALAQARPGGWRRVRDREVAQLPTRFRLIAAWRVDLPRSGLQHPSVDHVLLGIDQDFPLSEPRIVAPQAIRKGAPRWPHVEKSGALCLTTSRFSAPIGNRGLTILQHALDVLDMDVGARANEFRREFISYWLHQVKGSTDQGLALIEPRREDRNIWFHPGRSGQVVFSDDQDRLAAWLKNAGLKTTTPFSSTRLVWPDAVPSPDEYPVKGQDIFDLVGRQHLEAHLNAGSDLPVVLGFLIDDRPVFAGAVISGANEKFLMRGFRPSRPRPARLIADTYLAKPIAAMSIDRADPTWVHGRDVNLALGHLLATSIAIVGCGAIGGYLARGLAQAGIGSLVLIDNDDLKTANLGRHVLGSEWVGRFKTAALAAQIRRDFPHIREIVEHPSKFQDLSKDALDGIAKCDLLILAGVGLDAELAVDRWSDAIEQPPVRIWTWTEEFALAGHAVALTAHERIRDALDEDGRYQRRLTDHWTYSDAHIQEAGCGTSFQPYDAADMLRTVLMAQSLVTDVLLGKVCRPTRRAWLGDRAAVLERGGQATALFDRSFCELSEEWTP